MSEAISAQPSAEAMLDRAREVIGAAGEAGVRMRLLGGLGVFAVAESARRPPLARSYRDFDVAVPGRRGPAASRTLEAAGFLPDRHFNALHGAKRMIFRAPEGYPLDVLVGVFEMCHRLDISGGLERHELTIAPEDLLLTKLQIVRIEPRTWPTRPPCSWTSGPARTGSTWGDSCRRFGTTGASSTRSS